MQDSSAHNHRGDNRQLITFYIPLPEPVALPADQVFYARRAEPVPWLDQVKWPDRYRTLNHILRERNFVILRMAQLFGETSFDSSIIDTALSVAEHALNGIPDRTFEIRNYARQEPSSEKFVVQTIVEATTVLLPANDEDDAESSAFERVLGELRQWEMAYFQTTGDVSSTRISRSSVYPLIPYVTYSPSENRWGQLTIMQVNLGKAYFPKSTETLGAGQVEAITSLWQSIRRSDPLMEYEKSLYAADRLLEVQGDYSVSVVQLHTAGEILLDSLLISLAWEDISFEDSKSLTRDEVSSWFGRGSSLEKRLRSQYHIRLRGWTINKSGSPLHQWSTMVSALRNKIVHFGYEATVFEAYRCREAVSQVDNFVRDLLVSSDNAKKYPRTALIFNGKDRLQERGRLVGRAKQVLEDPGASTWASELKDFRSWIGELMYPSATDGS